MKIDILQKIIDIIRGKDTFILDCIYNLNIKNNYTIIPIGSFCLPRVITVKCHLKRRKFQGEKSYPFDLAFFNDFDKIIELFDKRFNFFYKDLEYQNEKYINKDISASFPHDGNLTEEEFIQRYNKRIDNLYRTLQSPQKIYFIYAGFTPLEDNLLHKFIKTIDKIRSDNYEIILIACNCHYKNSEISNKIKIINNVDINSINQNGNWIKNITKTPKGKKILKYLNKELKKYII